MSGRAQLARSSEIRRTTNAAAERVRRRPFYPRSVSPVTDTLDLARLRLSPGEGRRVELEVPIEAVRLGGDPYAVAPSPVPVRLDLSRTTGPGWALRLRFAATLAGPCMRCLEPAAPGFEVEAYEVSKPGSGEELRSPYVEAETLDLRAWGRDALALALPAAILCRTDCRGLCPDCGIDLNAAPPDHAHERAPDPRWAALRELRVEDPAA